MNNQEQYTPVVPVITLTPGKNTQRLAAASFVCGILSMLFLFAGIIPAFAPAYLGYAFYSDARRRGYNSSLMTAGQTMCIIGLALSLIALAVVVIIFIMALCGMAALFG